MSSHRRARALWVWTRPDPDALVAFAVAHGVVDLFVAVPASLPGRPADLAWLREVARARTGWDLRLWALGGDPGWCDRPSDAIRWQRDALATGLFAGTHADLEAWRHPRWDTARPEVIVAYLEVLGRLAQAGHLEVDVAWWLHEHHAADGTPLDEAVMRRVDAVTAMTYRTTATGPDSVTSIGDHALRSGARTGVPVRFAVETRDLGPAPGDRRQTFHGRPRSELEAVLLEVDRVRAGVPTYAGMAVHDHAGWTALVA